jgi:hypothetical protein
MQIYAAQSFILLLRLDYLHVDLHPAADPMRLERHSSAARSGLIDELANITEGAQCLVSGMGNILICVSP